MEVWRLNLGVGIVSFIQNKQQLPELRRCLNSCSWFSDVIIIDGKWFDIKSDIEQSIPEAIDMMLEYNNVTIVKSPNKPESYNRNMYLKVAKEYGLEYIFWVDTDEWVELPHGLKEFEKGIEYTFRDTDKKCAYLHCYGRGHGGAFRTQKLYKNPELLEHHHKHNEVFYGDINVWQDPLNAPRGAIIHHDKSFRLTGQKEQMQQRAKENPVH